MTVSALYPQPLTDPQELQALKRQGDVVCLGLIDAGEYDDFLALARAQITPPGTATLVVSVKDLPPGAIARTVGGRCEFLYDPARDEWADIKDELIQVVGADTHYMPEVWAINGDKYSVVLP